MKHFHCPMNCWYCPYYKDATGINDETETYVCTLNDPYHDCDDFYAAYGDCDPEDYTDEN